MKYDLSQQQSLSAKRSLLQLKHTLATLLMEKPFDKITIQDLCEGSMISKSTFYNYFEDKFDLLRYFFQECKNEITRSTDNSFDPLHTHEYLLDYLDQYHDQIKKILRQNLMGGSLHNELLAFMNQSFERLAVKMPFDMGDVPVEIRSKVNTYSFLAVIDWAYMQGREKDREKVIELLSKMYR